MRGAGTSRSGLGLAEEVTIATSPFPRALLVFGEGLALALALAQARPFALQRSPGAPLRRSSWLSNGQILVAQEPRPPYALESPSSGSEHMSTVHRPPSTADVPDTSLR